MICKIKQKYKKFITDQFVKLTLGPSFEVVRPERDMSPFYIPTNKEGGYKRGPYQLFAESRDEELATIAITVPYKGDVFKTLHEEDV